MFTGFVIGISIALVIIGSIYLYKKKAKDIKKKKGD